MDMILKTEQRQILSQKMIQSSDILQMAAAQLEEYLNEQALENPVLELTERPPEQFDNGELEKYQWICSHDEQNRYLYQTMEASQDDPPEWNLCAQNSESLRDHLWSQLLTKEIPNRLKSALAFLLDSLDSHGYFTDSLPDFAKRFSLSTEEASSLLKLVQSLEPAGVGAANLEECLCLQLMRQERLTPEIEHFIRHHLPEMAKNQLPAIAHAMKLPLETVKEFCETVRGLEPRPGALFSDVRSPSYLVPDVIIVKFHGHFDILLNESLYPDISLNSSYVRMCGECTDEEARHYLLEKIHQAQWLKQCIAQRNTTLLSIVQSILSLQQDFFLRGPAYLKPLRMSETAKLLSIHESTVSRGVRMKYLQCSWGIFPLSYFFAKTAVKTSQPSADDTGSTSYDVKKALAQILLSEDKKKPYSDRILSEMLTEKGYPLSRRTVAKYREEEGIPGASGRKCY